MSINVKTPLFLRSGDDFLVSTGLNDRRTREYRALYKKVKRLDVLINESLGRLRILYKKRARFSSVLINLQNKSRLERRISNESDPILKRKGRLERLSVCSKLLDSRSSLSSLLKSQPLPNLPSITEQQYDNEFISNENSKDSFVSLLRSATPENIVEYINNTGITYLVSLYKRKKFYCPPIEVDIDNFTKHNSYVISAMSSTCRRIFIRGFFDALFQKSQITCSLEDLTTKSVPIELLTSLEDLISRITNCKRVKLLLATDKHDELVYVHHGIKNIVPLTSGIIYNTLKINQFRIINDPNSSEEIDFTVEASIFEGANSVIVCPLYHPSHDKPFVLVGVNKLAEDSFCNCDFIQFFDVFNSFAFFIEIIHDELTKISEDDLKNLVAGISNVAKSRSTNEMIHNIVNAGNKLTHASCTRFLSIIDYSIIEEIPGMCAMSKTYLIDRGLICQSLLEKKTLNWYLPRRNVNFSVSIDDITEPRLWSMIASPIFFNDQIKGGIVLYNRTNRTFFSSKEEFIINYLSQCVCSFIHKSCESEKLHETIHRNTENNSRSSSINDFSLKSIQYVGTSNFYNHIYNFSNMMNPSIEFNFFIYKGGKLFRMPSNDIIDPEPQVIDAIQSLKVILSTVNDKKSKLTIPIKLEERPLVYVYEFTSELLSLKSFDEENGNIQRQRLLQSLEIEPAVLETPNTGTDSLLSTETSSSFNYEIQQTNSINKVQTKHISSVTSPKQQSITVPQYLNSTIKSLTLKNTHEDSANSHVTMLFDMKEFNKKNDVMFIVPSKTSSDKLPSFESQMEADSLHIVPFDPFLITILECFSNISSRQDVLHQDTLLINAKIKNNRVVNLMGNSLATTMRLNDIIKIMVCSLSNILNIEIRVTIFDTPRSKLTDDEKGIIKLEVNELIYGVMYIDSYIHTKVSDVIKTFADILIELLTSKLPQKHLIHKKCNSTLAYTELGFSVFNHSLDDNILIAVDLFRVFKFDAMFDITTGELTSWISHVANTNDNNFIFMQCVDRIQFAYYVFKKLELWNFFNISELSAVVLLIFFDSFAPKTYPCFKYAKSIEQGVSSKSSNESIARISTLFINLYIGPVDLLSRISEELQIGLVQILDAYVPKSSAYTYAEFKAFCKIGPNFEKESDRALFIRFLTICSQYSFCYRESKVFTEYLQYVTDQSHNSLSTKINVFSKKYISALSQMSDELCLYYAHNEENIKYYNQIRSIRPCYNDKNLSIVNI